jgi:hypothetical protein
MDAAFVSTAPRDQGLEIEMARITINTRDSGALSFFVRDDKEGYVYLESPNRSGTLGQQICEGGGTMGNTLMADSTTLATVARRWNKQRRAASVARGY